MTIMQTLNKSYKNLGILSFSLVCSVASFAGQSTTLKVMGYNVQNLFDTVDSPDTNDVEFTPTGAQKWTEQTLSDKIANLTEVIQNENASVLGLSEIENAEVLKKFQKSLAKIGYRYALAARSDDGRGIRTALVSKFPIVSNANHRVWSDSWKGADGTIQKTRDIQEVTIDASSIGSNFEPAKTFPKLLRRNAWEIMGSSNLLVTFLLNHWPSRGGGPIRDVYRLDVAKQHAQIVKNIVGKNPDRYLISLGDFNDELHNASFQNGMDITQSYDALRSAPVGAVYATDSEFDALSNQEKGTYYFAKDKVWNALDHILVSKGANLLSGRTQGFTYRKGSTKIVRPAKFMDQKIYPAGCELKNKGRSADGLRCLKGASDHLAMTALFDLNI